jgi:hypothetical protein
LRRFSKTIFEHGGFMPLVAWKRTTRNQFTSLIVGCWLGGIKIIAFAFQSHRLKKGGNLHAHQSAELHQSRNGVSFLTPQIFVAT